MLKVTDGTFESEVLNSPLPVMVIFSSPNCEPCKSLKAMIDRGSFGQGAKFKLVEIDVFANPQAAIRYNVRGVPVVMMFHKGTVVAQNAGNMNPDRVSRWIGSALEDCDEMCS